MDAQAWRFRAPLGPPLRRAAIAGIPVGAVVLFDLGLSAGQLAGIGIGALLSGFVAFDSPSGLTRAIWQVGAAPFIAFAGALGALTGTSAVLAVVTMTVFASVAALSWAVSLRFYVAAITAVLGLLLAQGLALETSDAVEVFALAGLGALLQAAFSLAYALVDRIVEEFDPRAGIRDARNAVAANLNFDSESFRHALRWGVALGVGVATYHLFDLGLHGYWVPLTILFVLRPGYGETIERIAMRGAGTVLGLLIATPLAELIGGVDLAEAVVIAAAAAFSYSLLAIEYALFTAAITTFAVVYAHALGQPAFEAAGERAVGTAIGLVICALAFFVFRDRPARPAPTPASGDGAQVAAVRRP